MLLPDLSNGVATVVIMPGQPQPGPMSITAIVCDANGCLTFTLSDGTTIGPVVFATAVAEALDGTQLVAANSDGSILLGKKAAIGRDSEGRLTLVEALPVGSAGLTPGSGILYRNADDMLGVA
ncbi:hypothetical protein K6L44_09260 [Gluconacetobacter entanii]|uniref:hypothetical protein n=1 Tax=Gluconacetobacter entanii TaxID=108528 RepID=UPI001C9335BC|nr:hypothetical protein [Gluconacetobacter entanii]MBY4640170.1 hypothetical protein [Gluconacetobacter entanii]MCW4580442.1 hypothetical protein [Gluconacetobacter entanii]MCW4583824.1 hypothetical protein [Gluconacetobacter entanii]MCW4587117.1 hypothetical protein [Gluconacetobacter entanii]